MNRTVAFILTFGLIGLFSATEAEAQRFFRRANARQATAYSPPTVASTVSPAAPAPRVYSYTYYSRSTLPARTYVGYGDNDFPFHGSPYGHPYDPYTWSAMSGSYQAEMSRYYSPPLK